VSPSKSARGILMIALGLGALGDLLLRPAPPGLGAGLWVLALATAAIVGRSRIASLGAPYPVVPLAAAAAFGLGFLWRDSRILQATFGAAAMAAWATAFVDRPARAGVTSHATASSAAIASAVLAAPLVFARTRERRGTATGRGVRVALAGMVLAAPLLLVFGTLFAAADPLFARYTSDLARSLDEAVGHLATILGVAWLTGGLIAGLALARCPADLELGRPRAAIGDAVAVALTLVVALFSAFLAVQARALLGGSAWIEARVGLSYAEYARQGFFHLLASAGIALPIVLAADWAVAPGDLRRRRMAALSGALVLMVLAVLASAARRMALYVDAYGLTELRLYASAVMAWLVPTFVAFAIAAFRGTRERFAFQALVAGGCVVLALAVLDPPAAIVRFNASRGPGSVEGFDALYASSLGADAVPALLQILPSLPHEPKCVVARDLLSRAVARRDADWRTYNVSRVRAGALLAAAEGELRQTVVDCPQTPGRSDQGWTRPTTHSSSRHSRDRRTPSEISVSVSHREIPSSVVNPRTTWR